MSKYVDIISDLALAAVLVGVVATFWYTEPTTIWYNEEQQKLKAHEWAKQPLYMEHAVTVLPSRSNLVFKKPGEEWIEFGMRSDGVVVWREYKSEKP